MPTATGEFHIEGWDEQVFEDGHDGRKLTRATVRQSFSGDIQGEGLAEYLMAYRPDGTADFTGLQRIAGKVAGIKGVIVLRLSGQFDGTNTWAETTVVSGAGRGALGALEGSGDFQAPLGSNGQYSLDYH